MVPRRCCRPLNGLPTLDAVRSTGARRDCVPVADREKEYYLDGWPDLSLADADLPKHFRPGDRATSG